MPNPTLLHPLLQPLFLSCALFAAAPGDLFTDLGYEAAGARAREDGLLLLVDATAEWCGPCQRMERETWAKSAVIEALDGAALAVQVDVDEQPEVARALGVSAMPTVVVFRDGTEVARKVGYMGEAAFLDWWAGVEAGEETFDALLVEDDALAGSTDADARHAMLQRLLDAREDERALVHLEWLWDNVGEGSSLVGVRTSFMLGDWVQLGRRHPPAREALVERLDALARRVADDPGALDAGAWRDWIALEKNVADGRGITAWTEGLPIVDGVIDLSSVDPAARPGVRERLFSFFLRRRDFAAAARTGADLAGEIDDALRSYKFALEPERVALMHGEARELYESSTEGRLRRALADVHATAVVAGRDEVAARAATELLDYLDDAESRVALVRACLDARQRDRPELLVWLQEAAKRGEPVDDLRREVQGR